jgi:hypothetical protein
VALKVLLLLARKALNTRDGLTKQAFIRSGTKSLAYNYASPERVRVADVLASVGSEGHLLYGGKPLRAESTLAELNIYSGSTLFFIRRLLGGMDGVGGGCMCGGGGLGGGTVAGGRRRAGRWRGA